MLILDKLFGSRKRGIFDKIIGHEHIKKLFRMTLDSNSNTHILLTGAPASAKTMFLLSLQQHLRTTFIDGGNTTKAGMIDYLFEDRPRYLLIDEIDKISLQNQTFLLNIMETGILSETKHRKTRQTQIRTSIFASSNDPGRLSDPILSRFFVVELAPYTHEQFYEITMQLLDTNHKIARIISDAVWNRSRDLRDCVRIGRLAGSEEDVKFLVENFVV